MSSLSFYAPFLLVPFAVQLAILLAAGKRFRPLRFAVPVLAVAVSVIVILLYGFTTLKDSEGILVLLNIFAILTLIIFCLTVVSLALIGWGLAWLAYYLIKRIGARKSQSV